MAWRGDCQAESHVVCVRKSQFGEKCEQVHRLTLSVLGLGGASLPQGFRDVCVAHGYVPAAQYRAHAA